MKKTLTLFIFLLINFNSFCQSVFSNFNLLRASSTTDKIIYITDDGVEGVFKKLPNVAADDDGINITTTVGTVTYKRIYNGYVNAKWFGAKGDGTTDDLLAIQKAITYCRGGIINGSNFYYAQKSLFFPIGTYKFTQQIDLGGGSGGVSIIGESPERTIFRPYLSSNSALLITQSSFFATYKDFTIDGTNLTGSSNALEIKGNSKNQHFENVTFSKCNGDYALKIRSGYSNSFEKCRFEDNNFHVIVQGFVETAPSDPTVFLFPTETFFDNCIFQGGKNQGYSAITVVDALGIYFNRCILQNNANIVCMNFLRQTLPTSNECKITNCYFENNGTGLSNSINIKVKGSNASNPFVGMQITDNVFHQQAYNQPVLDIYLERTKLSTVKNNISGMDNPAHTFLFDGGLNLDYDIDLLGVGSNSQLRPHVSFELSKPSLTSRYYQAGDIVWNKSITNATIGWICTSSGNPGQWKLIDICCTPQARLSGESSSSNVPTNQPFQDDEKNKSKLFQNFPNPLNETTTIEYSIIEEFREAQIMIYSIDGNIIQTIPIKNSGKSSININLKNWKLGSYYYSLVVDGKRIDSKKMILLN